MIPTLPLDKMSVEEKIRVMEAIWDDLCRRAEAVQSPDWHGEILAEREAAIERGEDQFEDFETAKEKIRSDVSGYDLHGRR